jgi:hypothetical protein
VTSLAVQSKFKEPLYVALKVCGPETFAVVVAAVEAFAVGAAAGFVNEYPVGHLGFVPVTFFVAVSL